MPWLISLDYPDLCWPPWLTWPFLTYLTLPDLLDPFWLTPLFSDDDKCSYFNAWYVWRPRAPSPAPPWPFLMYITLLTCITPPDLPNHSWIDPFWPTWHLLTYLTPPDILDPSWPTWPLLTYFIPPDLLELPDLLYPSWLIHLFSDDDECSRISPCSHFCHNTPGSFSCSCPRGLSLDSDGKKCKGVKYW